MRTRRCGLAPLWRLARSLSLATAVAAASGCTLAKLWDFPLGECSSSQDCRVLGDPSLPASCQEYVCQRDDAQDRNVCVLVTVEEVCDGGDNDCDGLIDERSSGQAVIGQTQVNLRAGVVSALTAATGSPEIVAWTEGAGANDFIGRLETTQGAAGSLVGLEPVYVTHSSSTLVSEVLTAETADMCYRRDPDAPLASCGASEYAMATDGEHVVYAQTFRTGCAGGQLRLSVASVGQPEVLYATGPQRRSNTYLGLLPHPTLRFCSMNTTDACAQATADAMAMPPVVGGPSVQSVCGVGHPTVALGTTAGLLAFLSAPATREACGDGTEVDVQAFGVYVRPKPERAQIAPRVEVTGEGVPSTLGRTRSGTGPAVAALGDEGFLVAFPDEDGDIAIHFVPTPPAPPANLGAYPLPDPDMGIDPVDLTTRDGVETSPLSGIRLVGTIPGDAGSNSLVLAAEEVTASATSVRVGLAWRSACDATGRLRFRSATLALDASGHPSSLEAAPLVSLSEAGLYAAPRIRFAPQGFLTEDAERGGATVGNAGGGWYVTWAGADSLASPATSTTSDREGALYMERLAAFDGLPVETAGPVLLVDGGVADHELVLENSASGAAGVTVRAGTSTGVLGLPLSCF
ncbi:MAG: hypothetical protein R3B40_10415 [Polyangiales bacterium]|nr:hypothetical protein [Myxococcales bacterium]MCB9658139.1 hypothetical protein [Sandaracinaceae bacterium]